MSTFHQQYTPASIGNCMLYRELYGGNITNFSVKDGIAFISRNITNNKLHEMTDSYLITQDMRTICGKFHHKKDPEPNYDELTF